MNERQDYTLSLTIVMGLDTQSGQLEQAFPCSQGLR